MNEPVADIVVILSLTAGQQVWISPDGINQMRGANSFSMFPGSLDISFMLCKNVSLWTSQEIIKAFNKKSISNFYFNNKKHALIQVVS